MEGINEIVRGAAGRRWNHETLRLDFGPALVGTVTDVGQPGQVENHLRIGGLIPVTPCTTACTRACTGERPPRSFPVIVGRLAPVPPLPLASTELAESAGFVNEKPPVSSCDIGGRQSGRGGSNSRHSAWEADVLPLNYARGTGHGTTVGAGAQQAAGRWLDQRRARRREAAKSVRERTPSAEGAGTCQMTASYWLPPKSSA